MVPSARRHWRNPSAFFIRSAVMYVASHRPSSTIGWSASAAIAWQVAAVNGRLRASTTRTKSFSVNRSSRSESNFKTKARMAKSEISGGAAPLTTRWAGGGGRCEPLIPVIGADPLVSLPKRLVPFSSLRGGALQDGASSAAKPILPGRERAETDFCFETANFAKSLECEICKPKYGF